LVDYLSILAPAFSAPVFRRVLLLALGWLVTPAPHTLAAVLVTTGLSLSVHHAAFHRVFSRARWSPDRLGWLLLRALQQTPLVGERLRFVLDDTRTHHKGPRVWGLGMHLDPVRSTRAHKVKTTGHVWVVLSIIVHLPCSHRPWAIPLMWRLYRQQTHCTATDTPFFKKTQLARQMLDVLTRWLKGTPFSVVVDEGYTNRTVLRGLPPHIQVFGAMSRRAALYDPAPPGGRRIYGEKQPTLAQRFADPKADWQTLVLVRPGFRPRRIRFQTWTGLWKTVRGRHPVRVVLMATRRGEKTWRSFVSTDPEVSAEAILLRGFERWSIEVSFRDMKQHLGLSEAPVRSRRSVERLTPWVGTLFGVVVLWYAQSGWGSRFDHRPVRPWYRHKRGASFLDMLGAAQRAAWSSGLFDPRENTHPLFNPTPWSPPEEHNENENEPDNLLQLELFQPNPLLQGQDRAA